MSSAELLSPAPQEQDDPTQRQLITGIPEHLLPENQKHTGEQNFPVFVDPSETGSSQPEESPSDLDGEWSYTVAAKEFFGGETFKGRPLIGRDSKIDGGVYYGTYGGEAIVVDSKEYPESYDRLLHEVVKKAGQGGDVQRGLVLQSVFETVRDNMRYSQDGVDKINTELGVTDGDKIELSEYIDAGIGVCRHQALTVAILLEKMKAAGHIRGQVSIDRSQRWNPIKGEREGHAWVRYTSHGGDVMILDVAQNYFGLLENSEGDKHGWDYLRPEEQLQRSARNIGNTETHVLEG